MGWLSDLFGQGARRVPSGPGGADVAGPDTMSEDVACMQDKWSLIDDVIEGHDAIKRGGEKYLLRFDNESDKKYQRRLRDAPWRPVVNDALENICSRPFTSPVTLAGEPQSAMKEFVEDVDGQGNSLNVFARNTFDRAVTHGVALIFVDFSRNVARQDGQPKTIADEREEGVRPFWHLIPTRNLVDVRTEFVRGREVVTHARWWEFPQVADGFAESCIPQVRVVEIREGGGVFWTIWQKQANGGFAQSDSGQLSGMTEVPLARIFTGRRKGTIANLPWTYGICQVGTEYYRALARQTEIENMAGWPMLAGQGIAKGQDELGIGPNTVLYAPPSIDGASNPKWEILGPDAALVEQIGKGPERVLDVFCKLALEPTIPKTDVTATASGIDNSRAHSTTEVWAGNLKNGLDEALAFTAQWLKISDTVTSNVSTDFAALTGGAEEAKVIASAQARGVISAETERAELKRRSILGPEFDEEKEVERIAAEREGLEPEFNIYPVSGGPVDATNSNEKELA